MTLKNKKGIELTLNTIVAMILLVIVLIVVLYFFTDTFSDNVQIFKNSSDTIIDSAKTGGIDN